MFIGARADKPAAFLEVQYQMYLPQVPSRGDEDKWSEDSDGISKDTTLDGKPVSSTTSDSGVTPADFPEVLSEITEAILELGGAVTPKLNWSSPKDAVWVTTGHTLRCTNAEEVVLLLKTSDRIAHDVCNALDGCDPPPQQPISFILALKKWQNLRPEREFRCFVKNHQLAGACQRHVAEHFPVLESQKADLIGALLRFHQLHLEGKFPDKDYTFDVYITTQKKVKLLDFNPIGGTTSPLLFTWEELGYQTVNCSSSANRTAEELQESSEISAGGAVQLSRTSIDTSVEEQELSSSSVEEAFESFELRIVSQENSIQPNFPNFGVPYDLLGSSMESPYNELLQKLREP